MRVKLKDLESGAEAWSRFDANLFWWSEGNGSCDCNRSEAFGDVVENEMEDRFGSVCYGCERFIAVDIAGDMEGFTEEQVIHELNSEYT